jgi:ABC-2 type transport system permease protein
MKILDIAFKDMLRYFRSAIAVGMMLVIPLLITGLIYAAFGGVLTSSETDEYTLPVIRVQVTNHDLGDAGSDFNAGQFLVDALSSESVKEVFAVTLALDDASARAAVDGQAAALALIIPENFTQAALTGEGEAVLEMYQDPTLSFGPGIAREIIDQFLDVLTGGQVAGQVMEEQLAARGLVLSPEAKLQAQVEYSGWFQSLAGTRTWDLPLVKRLPNNPEEKSVTDHRNSLMGPVMAGMMIFFVFFTGANTAQSLIKEHEEGTLSRLFTTPTPAAVILGGKFTAVFLTLIVQAVVLTLASGLVFGIDWGNLAALGLVIAGLVVSGAGFGILLMSFVKSTRQAGPVIGGVVTLTGMAGGLMTTGLPNVPEALNVANLFVPQGWAMRGMKLVLFGAAPQDVIAPVLVMLAFGACFFAAGAVLFRKRFA